MSGVPRRVNGWKVAFWVLLGSVLGVVGLIALFWGYAAIPRGGAEDGFERATAVVCDLPNGNLLVSIPLAPRMDLSLVPQIVGTDITGSRGAVVEQYGLADPAEKPAPGLFERIDSIRGDQRPNAAGGPYPAVLYAQVETQDSRPSGFVLKWGGGEPVYTQTFPLGASVGSCW